MNDIITRTTELTKKVPTLSASPSAVSSSPSISASSTTTTGVNVSSFDWWTALKYGAIILILALLGLNLFTYLGKATDVTAQQIGPLASSVGSGISSTTKQTVNVGAEGTKSLTDVAAGSLTSGISILEKGLGGKNINDKDITLAQQNEPQADEAGSTTQGTRGKSGYCYIGKDRNIRSCIKVNQGDTCMSGDIFPTKDLCVNPNLRQG
tara:strand:- start:2156 stop:2782 length:627 start_codon:yes stop_codon:yes gene_type:complete